MNITLQDTPINGNKVIPFLRFSEFEGFWKSLALKEIAVFSKGKNLSKSDIVKDGKFECIRYGELYTTYGEVIETVFSKTNLEEGDVVLSEYNDVIIPASGETREDIATASCVLKDDVVLGGDLNILKTKEKGVFLSYYLNYKKKNDIARFAQGSSVVHLYSSQLKSLRLLIPGIPEQQKIANFLSAVDKKIQQLTCKRELLEQYKKGVMQKIFSQEIRFKDENGKHYPDWERKKLNEFLYESKVRNYDNVFNKNDVLSVSGDYGIINQIQFQGRSFAGAFVDNYHVVEKGNIVYTKSPLKANPYGIIKVNKGKNGIVSTLYAVYKCKKNVSGVYLDYYFQLDDHTNGYLRPLVHKGAKNDMKINNARVLIDPILLPSIQEQDKIISFLKTIDEKIGQATKQLEQTRQFKKGLLQQMFV